MVSRLILHTDSISPSDVHTFKNAALQLQQDYQRQQSKTELIFVRSGQ